MSSRAATRGPHRRGHGSRRGSVASSPASLDQPRSPRATASRTGRPSHPAEDQGHPRGHGREESDPHRCRGRGDGARREGDVEHGGRCLPARKPALTASASITTARSGWARPAASGRIAGLAAPGPVGSLCGPPASIARAAHRGAGIARRAPWSRATDAARPPSHAVSAAWVATRHAAGASRRATRPARRSAARPCRMRFGRGPLPRLLEGGRRLRRRARRGSARCQARRSTSPSGSAARQRAMHVPPRSEGLRRRSPTGPADAGTAPGRRRP